MLAAAQSLRIYEILNKHFKNDADAKQLVTEIEAVIETRFSAGHDRLATKEDLAKTKNEIILWIAGFNTVLAGLDHYAGKAVVISFESADVCSKLSCESNQTCKH